MRRSSDERPASRRTPLTILLNSDEAVLIGEHKHNVGRTPAKPPFPGEEQTAADTCSCAPNTRIKTWHK